MWPQGCWEKSGGRCAHTYTHVHADRHTDTRMHTHTCEACADFGMALTALQTQFLPRSRRTMRKCKANKHRQPYVRKHRKCRVFRTLSFKQGPSGTSVAGRAPEPGSGLHSCLTSLTSPNRRPCNRLVPGSEGVTGLYWLRRLNHTSCLRGGMLIMAPTRPRCLGLRCPSYHTGS